MSLPPAEMEARLRAFYDSHNPGNSQNIAEIVAKYQGKEAALCARLKKKYGVAPNLVSPAEKVPSPTTEPTPTRAPAAVYDPAFVAMRVEPARTAGNAALDFRAKDFEALKALSARALEPPVLGLTPLDNIHKCRPMLPESDPNYQKLVLITAKQKPQSSKDKDAEPKPAQRVPILFETLADTYLEGPFTVLRRCFLERKRVRVVVRRVNSVRGACSGFLKAFDKHMNMVLLDVREQWIPPHNYAQHDRVKRLSGGQHDPAVLFSVADAARNRAFAEKRYAKQLFVRGDNVVMVLEDTSNSSAARGTDSSSSNRSSGNKRAHAYEPQR